MYVVEAGRDGSRAQDRQGRLAALAALAEPLRRSLYLYVVSSPEPVSRDAAAVALDLSRAVAAFHLDKLAEVGALEVDYRRPAGRNGPGAGRPAKYYRRAAQDLDFSVPERRYDLAAAILARAVSDATTESIPVDDALRHAAREYGRVIGAGRAVAGGDGGPGTRSDSAEEDEFERVMAVLGAHGYEPTRDGETITLGNCPFRALAEEHRALVCGMNLEVIAGVLEGATAAHLAARLNPAPGRCCVSVLADAD
jgi:predicted ArsR family transcriptional regulator